MKRVQREFRTEYTFCKLFMDDDFFYLYAVDIGYSNWGCKQKHIFDRDAISNDHVEDEFNKFHRVCMKHENAGYRYMPDFDIDRGKKVEPVSRPGRGMEALHKPTEFKNNAEIENDAKNSPTIEWKHVSEKKESKC